MATNAIAFSYDSLPGRIVFGRGSARTQIRPEIERLGLSRIMLIATPEQSDLASELTASFADRVVAVFADALPHVPIEIAEAARARATAFAVDGLLCVGGGSTTGTAKIVALTSGLPIIAVPTTYAGSEVTPVWGLTTASKKETGKDPAVLPRTVIYDSDLTRSLPPGMAIASGFNALAHCVEAFWGPGSNPITSLHAAEGIAVLSAGMRGLATGSPSDDDVDRLQYGAYLAGSSFAVAGSGLHHKICHALGGAFNLPHAETHAVILPHILRFNAGSLSDHGAAIAAALGATDAADALEQLADEVGAPRDLRSIGLTDAQLPEAIRIVTERLPIDNPRPVDGDAISALLSAAFSRP